MSRLHRTILTISVVTVPPLLAIALSHWGFLLTDGERRCYETLDHSHSPPGLVCSPGLRLFFDWFVFPSFHLVIALPLAWFLYSRLRPEANVLIVSCLALAVLGVAPIALYQLLALFPPGGDVVLFLTPFALCPSLAILGIALRARGRSNGTQAE